MQDAMLWHKERNGVRCDLCSVRCFISKEKLGVCEERKNVGNKLFTLNYGRVTAITVDKIEKKPLFHFYPNSTTLSIGVRGPKNPAWQINHDKLLMKEKQESPENIIKLAEKNNCASISYTHTEPTIAFEFVYKVARFAYRENILNVLVTNGYMTQEAIKKIAKYLNAAVVNFRASGDSEFMKKFSVIPDTHPIFDMLKQMKKHRIHVEITNMIIPQLGDNIELCRKLAEWINAELGAEVPFHILQFHPDQKLMELPPTPFSTLERCIDEARKAGLRYVYIGNVPKHLDQYTYCYNCKEILIKRVGYNVEKVNLAKDRCPNCGVRINIKIE